MHYRSMSAFAAVLAVTFSMGGDYANAAVSVTCAGGNQLSVAIATASAKAKPGDTLEFNIKGNCSDNIISPLGLRLIFNGIGSGATGGYGASLVASNNSDPALNVPGGWVTITNFYLQGKPNSTAETVAEVSAGGFLKVISSKVFANGTHSALASYTAALSIDNSVIIGDKQAGITVAANGWLWLNADNRKSTSVSYNGTQGGSAIGCWSSSLGGTTTGTGTITIGPSTYAGIGARGCNAVLGVGAVKGSIRIRQASEVGIQAKAGDMINLVSTDISQNPKIGLEVSAGVIELDNSTISKPSTNSVALSADQGGIIFFNDLTGNSSVSWTGANQNFYNCRQGGHIYGSPTNPTGGAATKGCLDTTDAVIQ